MFNMKKISLIALILLLMGAAGSFITFKKMNHSVSVLEEKGITDQNITHLSVTTDNAAIEIIPTNKQETTVEVSGTAKKSSAYTFLADVEGTTLSVQLKERQTKLYNFDFISTSLSLKVYVPEKVYDSLRISSDNGRVKAANLRVKEVKVKVSNGRVELRDITGSTITTETDNGRIQAENLDVKQVKATTSNGRIDLKNVYSSAVSVKADNGKIILDDVNGKVLGKVKNGMISLMTNHLDRPIEFESDNGNIKIQTEKEPTNTTFDVSVDNGKIDLLDGYKPNEIIGDGDHFIKLTTANGKISITKQKTINK
ncbi:DUF4097 family beta strand repeat-containing protein [Domibacillus aminovorans]|uniref:DUF4097 domain-containing protein n=1 Tax=Domibacillus aminovorans TaxID=29332 RepID=A0A177L7D2_9BACI|nr:DUF4097 family beta strand repeat-containing protein [Domibacillus aminovorans]OAH61257.1 hypothetical protein AWH49_13795 [Domibacillus aminovorans]